MGDIIVAMMYLYPGALVDVIRKTVFKHTFHDDELNESARVAKYFMFSTMISVASLLIYGKYFEKSVANQADILKALGGTMEIPKYFGVSLIVTALFTFGLEGVKELVKWARNRYWKKTDDAMINRTTNAWYDLVYGDGLKGYRGSLVLKIRNSDKDETCGFCYYLPDEFKDGISLVWQEEVKAAFDKDAAECVSKDVYDESRLIKGPMASYYDIETGTTIEFYDATKFKNT